MIEDQVLRPSETRLRTTASSLLVAGLVGGVGLGVVARAWMRFISEDPEFTWAGTLGIIAGFAFFGITQSAVAMARRTTMRRRNLTAIRLVGVIGMLPLFGAAGAVMAPTVIGAGLAASRTDWPEPTRISCAFVSLVPVGFVASDLSGSFGWSLRTMAGIIAMIAIYATIVWATQATLAPQTDGWRIPRWAKIAVPILIVVLVAIPLYVGGVS